MVINVDSKGYSKYIKFSPIKNIKIISEIIDEATELGKTNKDIVDELENVSRRKNMSIFGFFYF